MPRRRPLLRAPLLFPLLSIVVAAGAYIFGLSWLQTRGNSLLAANDLFIPRTIDVIVALWCFWVGSSIGSFLNVVAWRVPRGQSVNGRSHCPRCHTQLRARDNFPVFGWIALRGRCSSCHLPISPRYPIVEAVVGLSLTGLAIGQLYRLSLPHQVVPGHGLLSAPMVNVSILVGVIYHVIGVSFSWALGLIRIDGHRLPRKLAVAGLVTSALPICLVPSLMVVSWQSGVSARWNLDDGHLPSVFIEAIVRCLTGLAAAVVIGRSLTRGFCPAADPKLDPLGKATARLIDLIVILGVPAILVGWQAIPAVTVIASLLAKMMRPWLDATANLPLNSRWDAPPGAGDALGRFALAMPIALTLQIIFWRLLNELPFWPSDVSSPWTILAWAAAALMIPTWLHERPVETDASAPSPRLDDSPQTD